ncbi:MAG TPA: hypothetical protein VFA18_06445 [Gemmataceae bacterium]|nr:hypothetical protein [Gemmataceae bacterium]
MAIRCLSFVEYGETGWGWQMEKIRNPTWDDVVAAVLRLDKFRFPWVWLFIDENDEDPTVDCLTIMGGEGVYWVGVSAGKYDQLRLFDRNKSSSQVDVWTSDQGFSDCECHTTNDSELVLRIAKHFGDTGEPLPEASWEV